MFTSNPLLVLYMHVMPSTSIRILIVIIRIHIFHPGISIRELWCWYFEDKERWECSVCLKIWTWCWRYSVNERKKSTVNGVFFIVGPKKFEWAPWLFIVRSFRVDSSALTEEAPQWVLSDELEFTDNGLRGAWRRSRVLCDVKRALPVKLLIAPELWKIKERQCRTVNRRNHSTFSHAAAFSLQTARSMHFLQMQ